MPTTPPPSLRFSAHEPPTDARPRAAGASERPREGGIFARRRAARLARRRLKELERKAELLRGLVRRQELPPQDAAFLVEALARHDRIVAHLPFEVATQQLCLGWRENMLVTLEHQAARAQEAARQRRAQGGAPLPTTVAEEQRRGALLAALMETDERSRRDRKELLEGLEEVEATLGLTDTPRG